MLLPALIVGVAFFCEAVFGFGGGLIAVPLLSLVLPVHEAVTFALVFQFLMVLILIPAFRSINRGQTLRMGAGMVIGTVLGFASFIALSDDVLRTVLGVLALVFAANMAISGRFRFSWKKTMFTDGIAGALGGFFQGLVGTGGPVLTMHLVTTQPDRAAMRATLIALFTIANVLRVIFSASASLFSAELWIQILQALPVFLVAILAGHLLFHKTGERFYRIGVQCILILSGILMLMH